MDTVKLISEEIQDVEYITEQKENGKKNYKIKGIFMQADIKNRNGRIYPEKILLKLLTIRPATLMKLLIF